ncbi:16S rRNA (cytosine(967)-C(5))-methyltransferase RsmB [Myxococcota bacterium]|nr:16S rRNA (cytosine(967)-C(5))-methyltransferase RsmB [Myxococcota bacterium]
MNELKPPYKRKPNKRPVSVQRRQNTRPTQARLLAIRVLDRVESSGAFSDLSLSAALARSTLAPSDRALATELLYGTLRWRGRLDFLLAQVLDRKLSEVESVVRSILRIGAYQLAVMTKIPASQAVDKTVNCAKVLGAQRATGFINGVLRNLNRKLESIDFPPLDTDPLAHIVNSLSLPEWIAARWIKRYGAKDAAALAAAANQKPPLTIRTNIRRQSREKLMSKLNDGPYDVQACPVARYGLTIKGRLIPGEDPAFRNGFFTVQDEASQAVVDLLDPQPGDIVLDACAAPGTKATAIAERVQETGHVIAVDKHERRLALVGRDARRLGLQNIELRCLDTTRQLDELGAIKFDRVLIDAPCSGLGTIRRNPDARWRVKAEDPSRLAEIQKLLLKEGIDRLKPGGVLVYSTCTLEPEENDHVVDAVLSLRRNCRLSDRDDLPATLHDWIDKRGLMRAYPHLTGADGFFAAQITKQEEEN